MSRRSLAQKGYIVAAIEHRDGSASTTFSLNEKNEKVYKPYIKPSSDIANNHMDYPYFNWRQPFLEQRVKEVRMTENLLRDLSKSDVYNHLDNSYIGQFVNEMDSNVSHYVGHSFGGSTLLQALKDSAFKTLIFQDVWLIPLGKEVFTAWTRKEPELKKKVLILNSSTWTNAPLNGIFHHIFDLDEQAFSFPKTGHAFFSDKSCISYAKCQWLQKLFGRSPDETHKLINLVNNINENFIKNHCTAEISKFASSNEKLLQKGYLGADRLIDTFKTVLQFKKTE